MARYQKPPDPRNEPPERRRRRQRGDSREPVPWLWLGMGVVVTIVAIGLSLYLAGRLLDRPPLDVVASLPTPTVIRLTAPPSPTPSRTPDRPTPTGIPTLTPLPTPDVSTPPPEITAGYYAAVANTEGIGVTVRSGPSTSNVDLLVAPEGSLMQVIGGPQEGSNLSWWQVRLADGTEGWVAANFLIPAAAPATGVAATATPEEESDS